MVVDFRVTVYNLYIRIFVRKSRLKYKIWQIYCQNTVPLLRIDNEPIIRFADVEEKSLAAVIRKTDFHDIEVFLTGLQESLLEYAEVNTSFSQEPLQVLVFGSHAVIMCLGTGNDDGIFHRRSRMSAVRDHLLIFYSTDP